MVTTNKARRHSYEVSTFFFFQRSGGYFLCNQSQDHFLTSHYCGRVLAEYHAFELQEYLQQYNVAGGVI